MINRLLATTLLVAADVHVAAAHTLSQDENLVTQLGHQLLAWHHLPTTVLLLAGCAALTVFLRRAHDGKS